MKKFLFLLVAILSFSSCQQEEEMALDQLERIELRYAQGFDIFRGDDFWVLQVTQPWTGSETDFRYVVLEEGGELPKGEFDAVIKLPVDRIVLTSTTQIPHLDLLDQTETLVGFPNFDLISSRKVWDQIEANNLIDLGSGPAANPELLIDLDPDWVMISTLGNDLRQVELLKKSGIPAPINGEYVEQHPLGRAEWIKFTAILMGKYEEAEKIFDQIEKDYLEVLEQVDQIPLDKRPKVLSGVLYEDIWYAPGAESWGAEILKNAGGDYVFSGQSGTGSAQLSYEYVLDQALETDFWIGSADFESLSQMGQNEPRYRAFQPFQSGKIFTYTQKKGPKGGLEYFELGYMRPDLVLKDLVKILHPELLPDYQLYFYNQLKDTVHE